MPFSLWLLFLWFFGGWRWILVVQMGHNLWREGLSVLFFRQEWGDGVFFPSVQWLLEIFLKVSAAQNRGVGQTISIRTSFRSLDSISCSLQEGERNAPSAHPFCVKMWFLIDIIGELPLTFWWKIWTNQRSKRVTSSKVKRDTKNAGVEKVTPLDLGDCRSGC